MNGIATITIAGQTVGLKFGMPAVRRFFEKIRSQTADNPLIIDNQYTDLGLVHLLYAGYMNDRLMKDQPVALPFEAFYEFIESTSDETTKQDILAAIASFEASRQVKQVVAEVEEKKKALTKLTGTISKPSVMENLDILRGTSSDSPGENISLPAADSTTADQGNMSIPD